MVTFGSQNSTGPATCACALEAKPKIFHQEIVDNVTSLVQWACDAFQLMQEVAHADCSSAPYHVHAQEGLLSS